MDHQIQTVQSWFAQIKTREGQHEFLEKGIEDAINLASRVGVDRFSEADVLLVRLLRNAVPLGASAVSAILRGHIVAELVRALQPGKSPSYDDDASDSRQTSSPATDGPAAPAFPAACAQLLANLATSGSSGSREVWSHCFPSAFLTLVSHPAAQVHQPATLALYACCRQDVRRSRQLCGAADQTSPPPPHNRLDLHLHEHQQTAAAAAAGAGRTAATEDTSTPGAVTDPRDAAGAPTARQAAPGGDTSTSCCGCSGDGAGGGSDGPVDAGSAVRHIWEALLGRLLVSEQPRRPAGERDGGGGGGGGPDWTTLLCGCVGLRQGLLAQLLALLAAAPDAAVGTTTRSEGDITVTPRPRADAAADAAADPAAGAAAGAAADAAPDAATGAAPGAAADAAAGAAPGAAADAAADAAGPSGGTATGVAAVRCGRLWPALLHLVAHELFEHRGGGAVDVGATLEAQERERERADGKGEEREEREEGVAVGRSAGTDDGGQESARAAAAAVDLPLTARPVAAALRTVAAVADSAARRVAAAAAGEGAGSGPAGRGDGADLAAAVLEAALEVLKSITQREDGGRAVAGGVDLAEWLLLYSGGGESGSSSSTSSSGSSNSSNGSVLYLVLGMLAALQPAADARQNRRWRAAGADGGVGGGDSGPVPAAAAAAPPPDRPVVELPAALQSLAAGYPRHAAYMGYRGDLVSVLANGAFRRPRVVSELLAAGGLELLLAQTHLDEHSPLAREWALWGVRNMCEGNEEVQARIAGLQLQTTVETPELQKLGLRIELDKSSGKLKVSKTQEAEALLQGQGQGQGQGQDGSAR